jgi:FAD/FMN-containing dehydrogenase
LPAWLASHSPKSATSPYLADLANGALFIQSTELSAIRQAAGSLNGYAIALQPKEEIDAWGASEAPLPSLAWMKKVKNLWDPNNQLNPGAFIF